MGSDENYVNDGVTSDLLYLEKSMWQHACDIVTGSNVANERVGNSSTIFQSYFVLDRIVYDLNESEKELLRVTFRNVFSTAVERRDKKILVPLLHTLYIVLTSRHGRSIPLEIFLKYFRIEYGFSPFATLTLDEIANRLSDQIYRSVMTIVRDPEHKYIVQKGIEEAPLNRPRQDRFVGGFRRSSEKSKNEITIDETKRKKPELVQEMGNAISSHENTQSNLRFKCEEFIEDMQKVHIVDGTDSEGLQLSKRESECAYFAHSGNGSYLKLISDYPNESEFREAFQDEWNVYEATMQKGNKLVVNNKGKLNAAPSSVNSNSNNAIRADLSADIIQKSDSPTHKLIYDRATLLSIWNHSKNTPTNFLSSRLLQCLWTFRIHRNCRRRFHRSYEGNNNGYRKFTREVSDWSGTNYLMAKGDFTKAFSNSSINQLIPYHVASFDFHYDDWPTNFDYHPKVSLVNVQSATNFYVYVADETKENAYRKLANDMRLFYESLPDGCAAMNLSEIRVGSCGVIGFPSSDKDIQKDYKRILIKSAVKNGRVDVFLVDEGRNFEVPTKMILQLDARFVNEAVRLAPAKMRSIRPSGILEFEEEALRMMQDMVRNQGGVVDALSLCFDECKGRFVVDFIVPNFKHSDISHLGLVPLSMLMAERGIWYEKEMEDVVASEMQRVLESYKNVREGITEIKSINSFFIDQEKYFEKWKWQGSKVHENESWTEKFDK